MLDEMHDLARAGLAEMRALIFELRPDCLERDGLVSALERQAAAIEARHQLPIDRRLGTEPAIPLPIKEVVYRVGQEALRNAVTHARANRLELVLERARSELALRVADDGKGFTPGDGFPGHLGLRSMRERAANVGGTVVIESTLGEGTSVHLRIPLGDVRA
jgi:signal transduction histidine kinase